MLTLVGASVPDEHMSVPAVAPDEQQHKALGDAPHTLALGRQYEFRHMDPASVLSAAYRISSSRPFKAALEGMVPHRLFCATHLCAANYGVSHLQPETHESALEA